MDSLPKKPLVFDYLDVLSYLQDYYRYRKATNKVFSYEFWARELELNSKSFLRMVIAGKKKISPKFIESFSRFAFASKSEEKYFVNLVKQSQASSVKERQQASGKMLEILKHQTRAQVIEDKTDFISDPLLPRLLSILSFSDVRATVSYCAKLLNIDQELAQTALNKLEALELAEAIHIREEKIWVALSDVFHVPDKFGSIDLLKFHEKSLLQAISAFHQPKDLRKYKSAFLPLDEASLIEFNRLFDDFVTEQLLRFNSKTCQGKRMFQVNFNIHAVTEKVEAPPATPGK